MDNIEKGIELILKDLGEDINREGIVETPKRVARLFKKIFYGYNKKLIAMNEKIRNGDTYSKDIIPITIFNSEYDEMLIREVNCISFCEHHIVPFSCKVYVGIIPNKKILGLNKIDQIVKYFAARLQIQERMVEDIASWINNNLNPLGVMVVIKGRHFCAELQGDSGEFITSSTKGVFLNPEEGKTPKHEFLKLIEHFN